MRMITTTDTRLFRSLVVEALRLEGYDNADASICQLH